MELTNSQYFRNLDRIIFLLPLLSPFLSPFLPFILLSFPFFFFFLFISHSFKSWKAWINLWIDVLMYAELKSFLKLLKWTTDNANTWISWNKALMPYIILNLELNMSLLLCFSTKMYKASAKIIPWEKISTRRVVSIITCGPLTAMKRFLVVFPDFTLNIWFLFFIFYMFLGTYQAYQG